MIVKVLKMSTFLFSLTINGVMTDDFFYNKLSKKV